MLACVARVHANGGKELAGRLIVLNDVPEDSVFARNRKALKLGMTVKFTNFVKGGFCTATVVYIFDEKTTQILEEISETELAD